MSILAVGFVVSPPSAGYANEQNPLKQVYQSELPQLVRKCHHTDSQRIEVMVCNATKHQCRGSYNNVPVKPDDRTETRFVEHTLQDKSVPERASFFGFELGHLVKQAAL